MKKIITTLLFGVVLFSCVPDTSVDPLSELTKQQQEDQIQKSEIDISDEEFYALIQAIPTPLQSTSLMQAVGVEYQSSFILDTDESKKANSWFSQSVKLGIFGADMAYSNVYGETRKSIQYLTSIRGLADKLKIGQFFDVASIKQMVEQKDNLDELINISQMNFQKMNDYLQKQNRGKVSVAMILGGWVETLYLSAKVATLEKNNEALFENVSEQKFSLETIQLLLGLYASDKYFKIFKEEFQPLFTAYENVEVIFTQGEITYSEDAEGNMVAEDSSTSEIVFTKKDLEKITKAVSNLRKKLIEIE